MDTTPSQAACSRCPPKVAFSWLAAIDPSVAEIDRFGSWEEQVSVRSVLSGPISEPSFFFSLALDAQLGVRKCLESTSVDRLATAVAETVSSIVDLLQSMLKLVTKL